MVFSSEVFLFLFLPVVYLLYLAIPNLKARNILLIVVSLVFYAYGEPAAVLLMILSVICNYFFGRAMANERCKKPVLIVSVVFNVSMLFVFKYLTYTLSLVKTVFHAGFSVPDIALPIGISFFTFQAMSYVIDAYKKPALIRRNILDIFLYISFFPQLIAGPIIRFEDISRQIDCRSVTAQNTVDGIQRFICGLAKKVLIANTAGFAADTVFGLDLTQLSIGAAWIGAVCYTVQIYFDFSGYSDMAIGLGKMFGFTFKENFNYPLAAGCMTDFWRKWNISVSTWFKEYVYIPLGGNRKGKLRTALNRIIVFFFTGLWHGANWTFVLWGLWHGLFLLIEEYVPFMRKLPRAVGHIYTMLVVTLGFVLFRADTIGYGLEYIGRMFTGFDMNASSLSTALTQLTPWFIVMLIAAIIGCAPIRPLADKIRSVLYGEGELTAAWKAVQIALYVLAAAGLVWCILRLSAGAYNPFIYFRF